MKKFKQNLDFEQPFFEQLDAFLSSEEHNSLPLYLQSKDEKLIIVPFGSHFRGSKFIDKSDKITLKLTATFNAVCTQIKGYHYGRMDIKFDNWKDLEDGKNFAIIETNGAGSEPTHIYDPKHSIFFAWKEIVRHLSYLLEVCLQNKQKGYHGISLKQLLKRWSDYRLYMKEIE